VTPPEKINEPGSYLVINAAPDDLEMVLRWLQINGNDLIINLYYEHMNDHAWLSEIAESAEHILVELRTDPATVVQLPEEKITWIGQDQEYSKAIDYFTNNG
jgi:hypothetical protein